MKWVSIAVCQSCANSENHQHLFIISAWLHQSKEKDQYREREWRKDWTFSVQFASSCSLIFPHLSIFCLAQLLSVPVCFFIINLSVMSLSLSPSVCSGLTSIALSFFLSCDEVRYWKLSIMLFEPLQENISLNINLNTNTITNTDSALDEFYQQPKCTTNTHTHTRIWGQSLSFAFCHRLVKLIDIYFTFSHHNMLLSFAVWIGATWPNRMWVHLYVCDHAVLKWCLKMAESLCKGYF